MGKFFGKEGGGGIDHAPYPDSPDLPGVKGTDGKAKKPKKDMKERISQGFTGGQQIANSMDQPQQGHGAQVNVMSTAPSMESYLQGPGPTMFGAPFSQAATSYLNTKSPFFGIPSGQEPPRKLARREEDEDEDDGVR
jgi:hypothetical protein